MNNARPAELRRKNPIGRTQWNCPFKFKSMCIYFNVSSLPYMNAVHEHQTQWKLYVVSLFSVKNVVVLSPTRTLACLKPRNIVYCWWNHYIYVCIHQNAIVMQNGRPCLSLITAVLWRSSPMVAQLILLFFYLYSLRYWNRNEISINSQSRGALRFYWSRQRSPLSMSDQPRPNRIDVAAPAAAEAHV